MQTAVQQGPVGSAIANWVGTEKVDLLVMTSQGLGGWRRWVVGSVTERLVRMGVPALIVHPSEEAPVRQSLAGHGCAEHRGELVVPGP